VRFPGRVGDGLAMVVEAAPAGLVEPVAAGLAGLRLRGRVFRRCGGHAPDRFVPPDGFVFCSDFWQFCFEQGGVGDGIQVRPLGFDVAEEGLDPGLIGGSPVRPWCWMRAISAMNAGAQYDDDGVIGLDDGPDMRVVPLGIGERDRSGRGDGVRVGLTWSWSRRRGSGLFGGDFGDGDSRGRRRWRCLRRSPRPRPLAR
jgi:hypothetical protein